jgi:tetratricopeptide (TPR) repeat protein
MESAVKVSSDRPDLYTQLGTSYIRAGNEEKALVAYRKALELDPEPLWFNNIAYALAEADKQLPLALQYAERAVREEEEASSKVELSDLKDKDLGYTSSLAEDWDTLGWVYFRLGNQDKAEKYLSSAWTVSQYPVIGDHLGQVYEQQHKKDQAVRMYRLSLAASGRPDAMKDTQARLDRLGGTTKTLRFDPNGGADLSKLRTIVLPRISSETSSAEFFLLFGAGSKVAEVKFVSGSEKLKSADKALSSAPFEMPLPDDAPTHLLRRGVLSCSSITGCVFVLYTPDMVRSVN